VGTGKRLIAEAIHAQSQRCSGPFIRINCAAIPAELIEAELFGLHGVFSEAHRDKCGLIQASNGGSLLLAEIAEMPAHLQTRLLRVLHEHKLGLLDDHFQIDVNFRLVTTTNHSTAALLKENVLRQDLYFRISTIKIRVPPLRERVDDIPLLASHFLERFKIQYNRNIRGVAKETASRLLHYDWPGNICELESVIEHAVLFCSGDELLPECRSSLKLPAAATLRLLFHPGWRWKIWSVRQSCKRWHAPAATSKRVPGFFIVRARRSIGN
jgi:transcriptional regulator with PAS, ATPase and Fis domain